MVRTWRNYTGGRVSCSRRDIHNIAASRVVPHISSDGCNPLQKVGRSGLPNTLQRSASSSCTHGTPAGLPSDMPGSGEVIEGAMQQAAQEGRQSNLWELTNIADRIYCTVFSHGAN